MRYLVPFFLLLFVGGAFAREDGGMELVSYRPEAKAEVRRAGFVQGEQQFWEDEKPVWKARSGDVAAALWMATTAEDFRFHVVVEDPEHNLSPNPKQPWRGDCIYLSLDGRGDDSGDARAPFGPDDAVYMFLLGEDGPQVRVNQHGNASEMASDQKDLVRSIVRDDAKKTTMYDIAIPMKRLSTALGQTPTMGLAVTIAHKNKRGDDLNWGRITASRQASGLQPRELHGIALRVGEEPFASVAALRARPAVPAESAEVTIAVKAAGPAKIIAKIGEIRREFIAEATDGTTQPATATATADGIRRHTLRIPYELITAESQILKVDVVGDDLKSPTTERVTLNTPHVTMEQFRRQVQRLLASAPNDLTREHLNSTLLVAGDALTRLPLEVPGHPDRANEFIKHLQLIASKLPSEKLDWNDYIHKCIPLAIAFSSEADRTLQYFSLQLPYDYSPEKSYPLTIYLHGSGNPNPLGHLTTCFDNSGQDTLFRTVEIEAADVPASHRGFILAPWSRGNSFYEGEALEDLWQSIKLLESRFKIDRNRIYLTGFSMGCQGALAIAARHPDVFAGVNLASNFGPFTDARFDHIIENLRGLPISVWTGEEDIIGGDAKDFHARLLEKQFEHRYEIAPKLGHTYPYLEYQKNVAYLMQFTRKCPTSFSYVADAPNIKGHALIGRNGVLMSVPRPVDDPARRPEFTCSVAGQTVTIESKNTNALRVDLDDPDGLNLSGEVKVIWNGKQAYSGRARRIELGMETVPRWPPVRR